MRVLNKKFKLYRRYKTDFWGQPSLVRSRSKKGLFSEIIRLSPFSLRKKLIAYAPHRYFSLNRYRFKGFPGRRANKFSGYFSALQAEKSKFQIFYHSMRERQIRHLVKISSYKKGVFVDNFVSLIERRLDIILFRSLLLFPSTTVQINRFLSHRSIHVLRIQSGGKQQKKKIFLRCSNTYLKVGDTVRIVSLFRKDFRFSNTFRKVKEKFLRFTYTGLFGTTLMSQVAPRNFFRRYFKKYKKLEELQKKNHDTKIDTKNSKFRIRESLAKSSRVQHRYHRFDNMRNLAFHPPIMRMKPRLFVPPRYLEVSFRLGAVTLVKNPAFLDLSFFFGSSIESLLDFYRHRGVF